MKSSGINLFFSHSVERLTEVMAEQLKSQQATHSLFQSPHVLVPNTNMQRYLQLSIANLNGICAQVDFPFLETGLFQLINRMLSSDFIHLNGSRLAWSIWQVLKSEQMTTESVYKPIHDYLNEDDSPQLRSAKLWQLSQKLAKLLIDYESQRPEMMALWLQNKLKFNQTDDSHLKQLEAMQKELYMTLVGHLKSDELSQNATLFQLAHSLSLQKNTVYIPPIHVFTPSRLSQLHRQILGLLGQHITVNIYQLNVCLEYWEDLQTENELTWYKKHLSVLHSHSVVSSDLEGINLNNKTHVAEKFDELELLADENKLLRAWGKPGREALKLFSELENDAIHFDVNFNDVWIDNSSDDSQSILKLIQQSIINRTAKPTQISIDNEVSSLQFIEAPSIHREVAGVYNSILWNLENNPDLKLNDIAILVTDMNQYRYVLEQVFEELNQQNTKDINYCIADSNAEKESLYAAAVLGLFEILSEDFIRSSVFEWFDNICVQSANDFGQSEWNDWLFVVDQLGIYCGFDTLYQSFDTLADENLNPFTWQQGLRRLNLSLAQTDADAEFDVSVIGAESIGQLTQLLETLNEYKSGLQHSATAVQWEQRINQMLDLLIAVPVDHHQEQHVQLSLQQSLLNLSEAQPELLLEFEDIKQFIQHEIKQIPAGKGNYLTGGVVCAALQPMRPIPFKVTYILGLDERSFPGQSRNEVLDLTSRSRRIGDISPIENKNYLFLETLMCTRDRLYVSYVGTDLRKDESIEPSATWLTLYEFCQSLINRESTEIKQYPVIKLPLAASESFMISHENQEWSDVLSNYSYLDYLIGLSKTQSGSKPVSVGAYQQQMAKQYLNDNPFISHQLMAQQTDLEVCDEVIDIQAAELAVFLENPQKAVLTRQGVQSRHPEDVSLEEHEPFKLGHLAKFKLFHASITQWLDNPKTANLEAIVQHRYLQLLNHSKVPVEMFMKLDELSVVEKDLRDKLLEILDTGEPMGTLKMGDAMTQYSATKTIQPIDFVLASGQKVRVHGVADHLYSQSGVLSDQIVISSSSQSAQWNKKYLKPFVDWCLWQLTDEVEILEPFGVHVIFPDKVQTIDLRPWYAEAESFATKSTIKAYLTMLIEKYIQHSAPFLSSQKLSSIKITKKDQEQYIPLLGPKSKAKDINFLAYQPSNWDGEDLSQIQSVYEASLNWPDYEEILKTVDFNKCPTPADEYRSHLLPLYAMVFGRWPEVPSNGERS